MSFMPGNLPEDSQKLGFGINRQCKTLGLKIQNMKQPLLFAVIALVFFACKKDDETTTTPVSPKSCRVVSSNAGSSDKNDFSIVYDANGRIASYTSYPGSSGTPVAYTFEYGTDNKVKVSASGSSIPMYAYTGTSGQFTKAEKGFPYRTMDLQFYSDGKLKGWEAAITDTNVSPPKGVLTIFYEGNDLKSMSYTVINSSIPSNSTQFDFEYSSSDTKVYKAIPFQIFYDHGSFNWLVPPINGSRMPSKMTASYKDPSGNPIGTPDVYTYSVDLAGATASGQFLIKGLSGNIASSKWMTGTHNLTYENCE